MAIVVTTGIMVIVTIIGGAVIITGTEVMDITAGIIDPMAGGR
jgi:hypothetical protein